MCGLKRNIRKYKKQNKRSNLVSQLDFDLLFYYSPLDIKNVSLS